MKLDSLIATYSQAKAYTGRWQLEGKSLMRPEVSRMRYNILYYGGTCVVDIPSLLLAVYAPGGHYAHIAKAVHKFQITECCPRSFISGLTGLSWLFAQWLPCVFLTPGDVAVNRIAMYESEREFLQVGPTNLLFCLLVEDGRVKAFRHKSEKRDVLARVVDERLILSSDDTP